MPRQEIVISLFVSSPSDVAEERDALEDVVRELNKSVGPRCESRMDLIRWETDFSPGHGAEPQDVVNQQIPDDYDLYIGIIWSRIGTKTTSAVSGTVEEFRDALKRKQKGNIHDIMIYVKDAPVEMSMIDPEQISGVREFCDEASKSGCFYSKFNTREEFTQKLRLNLTTKMWDIAKSNTKSPKGVDVQTPSISSSGVTLNYDDGENDEDVGILDAIEYYEDKMGRVVEFVEKLGRELESLSQKVERKTSEIESIVQEGNVSIRNAKRVINSVAEDMNNFVYSMENDVSIYSRNFASVAKLFIYVINAESDLDKSQDFDEKNVYNTIEEARSSVESTRMMIEKLITSVATIPRMTTRLNSSKRRLLKFLESVKKEFGATDDLIRDMQANLK